MELLFYMYAFTIEFILKLVLHLVIDNQSITKINHISST